MFPELEPGQLFLEETQPTGASPELSDIVYQLFTQAKAAKQDIQGKLEIWRQMFLMKPPQPPFEDALVAGAPVVRQKADGVRAHIKVSIDREPMFTLRVYSPDASDVAPALESVLERELQSTGSKHEIEKAVDDAVIYGTGVLKIAVIPQGDGEFAVALRYVPLKNVWAWPDKYDPKRLAWFEAYWQPLWEIQRMAEAGYYDQNAVNELANFGATSGGHTGDNMGSHAVQSPDQKWFEVVEGWFVHDGKLHRVVFTNEGRLILRVETDPYDGALDAPPYYPIYIDPDQVRIWGHGMAEVLESLQIVSDAAINSELWSSQYKMRPPVLVKASSPLYKALQRANGFFPGQVLPYDGLDADNVLKVVEFNVNPFNMTILALMNQMSEDATLSDFIVPGTPLGGRKTATEVQITSSIGQLKLANFLRHVQRGLEAAIRDYWRVLVAMKIANAQFPGLPRGVYRTWSYSGGGKMYVTVRDVRYVYTRPEDGTAYEIFIPGALRDDAEWVLTGSITVPERELRLQRLSTLINPAFLQLIQAARQDPGVHTLMRRFLDALGFAQDAELILGPPPTELSPSQALMAGLLQGMTPEEGGEQGGQPANANRRTGRNAAGGAP